MKKYSLLVGMMGLTACGGGGGGGGGGTASYKIEFLGTLNTGASFSGVYVLGSGQGEAFADALPASKTVTAGANEYVYASATVSGGGNITVKVFKGSTLCEEKTVNVVATGIVAAACNRP